MPLAGGIYSRIFSHKLEASFCRGYKSKMLFRRRKPVSFSERIAGLIWPRRSLWRTANYVAKRILRLAATPHAIGAGVAAGVFAGTAVGNPLTFPFIWAATFGLGRLLLSGQHPEALVPFQVADVLRDIDIRYLWNPLLKPMTVGGILLGVLFGMIFYVATRWATAAFITSRRKRLIERSRNRADRFSSRLIGESDVG
jgi:uncharacterized protein (DUF2062 family)